MAVSQDLLATAASIIADYREGEIFGPDAAHVDRWLSQFDEAIREPLLTEMNHVLGRTYVSKKNAEAFLVGLATLKKIAGDNPKDFWVNAKFLDVQMRGKSQHELLSLFGPPLKQATGLEIADCGKQPNSYIYLDDGIFTGMTLIQSLTPWLKNEAPQKTTLHIIVMAGHAGGKYYAETSLKKVATGAGKEIDFHWWALLALEDRKANINISDVLRPTSLPDDERTRA
jgi:hypothetical protein